MILAGKRFEPGNLRARQRLLVRSILGLALLLGIPGAGQSPYPQFPSANSGRSGQSNPDSSGPFGQDSNGPDKKRIRVLNAERQKTLVSDTERLLKLAKELNDEMAANESGPMSGAALHKVEEIGKLAKSVKEKMSFSVGGYPGINAPLTIQPGIQ
jgi:hypothetical protein